MVQAVRIEGLNPIQPLWDLHVSLLQFGAETAARPENRIRLEEFRWVGDPHLKQVLLLEPDKRDFGRRVRYADSVKIRCESLANDIAELLNTVVYRLLPAHDLDHSNNWPPQFRPEWDGADRQYENRQQDMDSFHLHEDNV